MHITAIDPGTTQSALVDLLPDGTVLRAITETNERIIRKLRGHGIPDETHLAIEVFQKLGQDVGQSVFDTAIWVGRFIEAWQAAYPEHELHTPIRRMQEKMAICNMPQAKDKEIRAGLIDLYGGSKEVAVGLKASQGPLYGIVKHEWSALAVGVTYLMQRDPLWQPTLPRRAA